MTWHYATFGPVTHVRVFCAGVKCGELCFRTAEFDEIRANSPQVLFVEDFGRGGAPSGQSEPSRGNCWGSLPIQEAMA